MDAISFFLVRYGDLHRRRVDDMLSGLSEAQVRGRPHPGVNTVAWLLWHAARIEDVGVNRFVADRSQVLDEAPAGPSPVRIPVGTPVSLAKVALWIGISLLLPFSAPEAAPLSVRLPEGNVRGFLALRSLDGTAVAHGEFHQKPQGNLVDSRLVLNFKDGSLYDETATFSQEKVFRLEAYRLLQRGPSFPTMEVSFERKAGRYQARTQEKKGDEEKAASGELQMPDDLYNGMALILLKNLPPGAAATAQMAAFTPKPRLIKMQLSPEGEGSVLVGGDTKRVTRYLVKLEIGGLTGVIASLIGKKPPDLRYWFVTGDVPAFVRFEGAMFLNGPVWRLDLATVEWPKAKPGNQ